MRCQALTISRAALCAALDKSMIIVHVTCRDETWLLSETSGRAAEKQIETIVVTLVFDLVPQSACIYGSIHFAAEVQALCISELFETEHPSKAQLPY